MEIYTRRRSPVKKTLVIYSVLFVIPAVLVFVVVQMQFQGLPPRYQTQMTFLVDPHLKATESVNGESEGTPGGLTMDVRSMRLEIKSRDRLREALAGIPLYEDKKTAEKKQLFLEQARENFHVNVERASGQNAYLVTVSVSMHVKDPAPLEALVKNIRTVYMKYNVERLAEKAQQNVDRLASLKARFEEDYGAARSRLDSWCEKPGISDHLGQPPPIVAKIAAASARVAELENQQGKEQELNAASNELKALEDLHKTTPQKQRRYKTLVEQSEEALKRVEDLRKKLRSAEEAVQTLRTAKHRFKVIKLPESRPVESEESSRMVLGITLGAMAGLVVVLAVLLLGIAGGRQ